MTLIEIDGLPNLIAWWIFPWRTVKNNQRVYIYDDNSFGGMFFQIAHYNSNNNAIYNDDNDSDDNDNGGNIVIVIIIMMMIIIMIMIIIYYDNIGTIPWISMDQMFHRNAFGKKTHKKNGSGHP
jgi:hypothetical protein